MTTDDPTTRPAAAVPERTMPPHPPDAAPGHATGATGPAAMTDPAAEDPAAAPVTPAAPAAPAAGGPRPVQPPSHGAVPLDASHPEAPPLGSVPAEPPRTQAQPFGTVPVDPAHADALRMGAVPAGAVQVPTASTTHANGTHAPLAPPAPANGTRPAPAPGAPGTAAHPVDPASPADPARPDTHGARPEANGARPDAYDTRPEANTARPHVYDTRPEANAPQEAATYAAPADTAVTAAVPGEATDGHGTAAEDAPPEGSSAEGAAADGEPAGAVDTALVDAVLAETSGTGADDEDSDERIRTLIWTAATYRPLEEVTALVTQLKHANAVDSPADEALRAAAVARPLDEVRQLVAMLNEAGHTLDDSDTTLRAAAVGRPIEDVVQLVSILGTGDTPVPAAPGTGTGPAADAPAGTAPATAQPGGPAFPVVPENPHVRPPRSATVAAAPAPEPKVLVPEPDSGGEPARTSRSGLRWPAAAALFACGIIHLPTDFTGLRSGGYADAMALVVTVVCLVLGEWLIVRDSPRVWGFAAVTSVGVVALHGLAGSSGFAVLASSLGRSWAWSGVAAVMCAMLTALLAGSALLRREREPDATNGT
ncbi:hypothetical protein [Streptomyces sp. NPDC015131]|uniref:hypothetical protein n=1 Tax=Streptomyces sp. NPDC015131 TaxID=3364941 RepID=UPI0036F563EC